MNGTESKRSPGLRITPEPVRLGPRIFIFYSMALLLTGMMAMLFADLLWRTGWSASRTILLALFVVLFFFASVGCLNGIFGFILRRVAGGGVAHALGDGSGRDLQNATIAIVVPVYNEEVVRVFEGLRATYESLAKTGQLERFDFFVLSDSTEPGRWVAEERVWCRTVQELGALGRIYYRHRLANVDKKSGNIRDFLRAWGRRYRYFLILDADSVMSGDTLVELVRRMEANPGVGLIQTVPALVNAESLFGRMQQFANRFYSPIFITGMNYWSQGGGNYWGHNAIIRTEPFMRHCDLPKLPGRRPFGGHILSHDFVEAALLLKAGWQVWLAHDLAGSYEEAPQGMIENAQRDRRWCQGNLQHGLVLFARGLRGISRWHLIQGICGYLTGPLWLAFLLTFDWMWISQKSTGLSQITVRSWSRFVHPSATQEALAIFLICMGVLLLPRVLAVIDLARRRPMRTAFGGLARASVSMVLETVFSTLHAPLQMLWHSQFVITILLGINVGWEAQKRHADGTTWSFALRHHWGHTLIGVTWGGAVWLLAPPLFWWFTPVLAGMVVAVPLSVFTSRSAWGNRARGLGLFLTPEETSPPPQLATLRLRMAGVAPGADVQSAELAPAELAEIFLDPYVNAIHVTLLRENNLNPEYANVMTQLGVGSPNVGSLGEKLLAQGIEALTPPEMKLLICDADVMSRLHREVWLRSKDRIALSWQRAIRRYASQP